MGGGHLAWQRATLSSLIKQGSWRLDGKPIFLDVCPWVVATPQVGISQAKAEQSWKGWTRSPLLHKQNRPRLQTKPAGLDHFWPQKAYKWEMAKKTAKYRTSRTGLEDASQWTGGGMLLLTPNRIAASPW